jgi:hypothetical protein
MNIIPVQIQNERYLDPYQARKRPPTSYEDLLGDAIERAFGAPWTAESYQAVMKTLGE